ncbi:MAG: hypothetical protein HC913_02295 [Microscillaceae bacterium]|nr:hypothetical protein [Microscillaceae bacterium]
MQKHKLWCLAFGLFGLMASTACDTEPPAQKKKQAFYDVKDFLDQQIHQLNSLKLRVQKKSGQSEFSSPQEIKDWAQELALFTSAHINRPIFEGEYALSQTVVPVKKLLYKANSPELTTREIEIIFSANQLPDTIRFLYQKKSWFYDSERKMEMVFARQAGQKIRLAHYKVVGFQKSILGDCQNYALMARLTQ